MRADERRIGVRGDQPFEPIHQVIEPGEPTAIAEPPVGVVQQLFEPFVPRGKRIEERDGISRVYGDRDASARARIPHGREAPGVGHDELPATVA